MIDPNTVEEVLATSEIDEVISEFVTLKKRGANFVGLCPFHNEKTPSFTVSPGKGIYKCFGCGQAGNVSKFLMDHEQFSFPEAIKWLADRYNIEIDEGPEDPEKALIRDKKESYFVINSYASRHFTQNLFDTDEGRSIGLSYFKERGYREDTIRKFSLGYAMSSYESFSGKATEDGYELADLKELGLVKQKEDRHYDFFRERVMFCIHNLSGKIIAFAGRTLSSDKKMPKYINSPESPIYNKSKVLYGAFQARNAIRKEDKCYLVEGYTDVISLHQDGIENVVASSGTSLTEDQIRLIKRYTSNILFIYDGDEAGEKATSRGLDIALEQGLNVKVVILPEGEDPDSFIRKEGKKIFKEYVEGEALDFLFFKARKLAKEAAHDPVKKTEVIKDIVQSIARIPDPIKRSLYLRECSELMSVREQLLVNETNRVIRNRLKKRGRRKGIDTYESEDLEKRFLEKPEEKRTEENNEYQERDLVRLLLQYGERDIEVMANEEEEEEKDKKEVEKEEMPVAVFILNELQHEELENEIYRRIINIYREFLEREEIPTEQYFIQHADPEINELAINLLTDKYEISKNWHKMHDIVIPDKDFNYRKDVKSAVARYLLKKINRYIRQNSEDIKETGDEDDLRQLLLIRKDLNKKKNHFANLLHSVVIS